MQHSEFKVGTRLTIDFGAMFILRESIEFLRARITLPAGVAKFEDALSASESYTPFEQEFLAQGEANDLAAAKQTLLDHARPTQAANIDALKALVAIEEETISRTGKRPRRTIYPAA